MKVTHSQTFECPPAALWPWIDDPEKCKQWLKGVEEFRPVSEGPRRPGWQAKMMIREGRQLTEYDETILEYVPRERFKIEMKGGCFRGGSVVVDYKLVDLGGRTRLDYECEARMQGFAKLFAPFFFVFGRMQVRSVFKTLKRLAESSGGVAAATG